MAKAQLGRKYAQVIDGRCHWLFTAAELPEWNDADALAVDVTGNEPAIGDVWDGTTFSAPVKTPDEIAAEAAATKLRDDTQAARQYAKLRTLVTMSPAEIDAWITANVTNLAQAQDAIKTLAIGLSVLARKVIT